MQPVKTTPPRKNSSGLSVAGMVLGIISCSLLFVSCFVLFFISFPLAVLGLVFSAVAGKKDRSSVNISGLVLNITALSFCCIAAVCVGFSLVPFFPFF